MIIRDAPLIGKIVLTPNGELHPLEENENVDLLESERRDSFLKGENHGYEKTYSEIKALYRLLQTIVKKLLEEKERLLDQLKPEIIAFSLQVCERIIRRELTQPEPFIKLINTLLQSAISSHEHDRVHIILSPDDLSLVESRTEQLEYDKRKVSEIKLSSDALIRRGDVWIETRLGLLNYDISRELFELKVQCLNC